MVCARATSVWPCDATAMSAVTPFRLGVLTVLHVIFSQALTIVDVDIASSAAAFATRTHASWVGGSAS